MREAARAIHPATTFLILALTLGLGYVVINPPFAVNDEDVHMARVFELASGRLLTRTDAEGEYHEVPADYVELGAGYQGIAQAKGMKHGRVSARALLAHLREPRAPGPLVRTHGRAGGYAPLPYHFQIAAVWLCERLDLGVLYHLYLARIASLLVYVFLCWHAVRLAGRLSWLFTAIALMPMALTQAAAVSGDGMVIGLSLLFFALIAKGFVAGPEPLSPRALLGLMACLILLTLSKPVYVVAALALPTLRWELPHANWKRFLYPLLSIALASFAYAGWRSQLNAAPDDPGMATAGQQMAWLASEPTRVFDVALATAWRFADDLLIQSIFVRYRIAQGMRFAGGFVSVLYAYLLLGIALGAARRAGDRKLMSRRLASACFAVCALAISSVVPAAVYMCCNRVGGSWVTGFHGRYLIPAFPPLLLALSLVGRPVLARWLRLRRGRLVFAAIVLANCVCYFSLIGWHYYPNGVAWPL
jgi:uncharacterized membrane protein